MLVFVGFMLSPLSWWNDAFVNLPLAVAFAWVVGLFYRPAFDAAVVIGYWLTNVLGFVLLHKGGGQMLAKEQKPYSRRDFARDMGISLAYTLLIIVLLRLKVLQPMEDYFHKK